jgi:uncharacterized protein YbbC (DUF1343 family)
MLSGQPVRIGAEILIEKYLDSLTGKRIGIICNHTSVLPNGIHIVDTLLKRGVNITALFAPEHGIRGVVPRGEKVSDTVDNKTGLKVYSLYGGVKKPTRMMLYDVDVLIFDMQDVGARFYTYASTMAYCMMAAGEFGKKFFVLDRPNPINGVDMEGPVLDLTLMSFLGIFPIPIRHGLTLGELAAMAIGEGYLNPSTVDLKVIPMENWKRSMWYDETSLPWIPPSPNMRTLATATVYPGTCLFEATNISEGRGTAKPFEYIGAPRIDGRELSKKLNSLKLPGVNFSSIEFTPVADTSKEKTTKYGGKRCRGVYVQVTDRKKYQPVLTGIMMIKVLKELYPKLFQLRRGLFNHLAGDEWVGDLLESGKFERRSPDLYRNQILEFEKIRSKYLLY